MLAVARTSRRLLTLVAAAALPAAAHAQVIDFDDIPTPGYQQLDTYHGFTWANMFVLRAGTSFAPVAAASSPNVIFPGFGSLSGFAPTAGGTFTLGSIDFTQWAPFGGSPAPSTTVTGLLAGVQLFQTTVALGPSYATTVFNWTGIDQVMLDQGGAGWFAADNVVTNIESSGPVTSTPEPATYALVAGGLVAFGIVRRRRA
jgi:hypothetical protein